ncbi:glycosyltransferase family 4 protein [Algibacter amylolyticus]|uniref:Glycosyltransferase family 4 protein n=1 Tax=Algibacter amylolyticus TaxID=1608400 RepID=A0A5M7B835_9FLAO|nr:glycosyltransferase family 4 protein [Algibacter amylolyticus]KAA5824417.1 glycosyltransferase family 4 protein [Algibacter amylolyticus]MBB5269525.1 glycosyltransferase involved in cell wall biosynthesis [Algibacter amylolyticus]TSJ75190.1 glycosyltransferase family 4 protein [Algibacter amylolyticus]
MRLLQITASSVWRGHEQQIVYYYDAFDSKIEHQVLICPTETKLAEIAASKNYNVHALPLKSEYSRSWIKKIKQVVKEEKIDLVLIHNSTAHTLCVIASLLSIKKTPLVFFRTLIKDIATNPLRKWKYNYKHLVKLICVSQAVIDVLGPSIKDHSRFSIVGSATNLDDFKLTSKSYKLHDELGLPHTTQLIANISAFVPFKDHFTFVKTVSILKDKLPNAKFLLIGTGKMEDEIKAFTKELGLENHILFLGFRNDIPEIFADFDLFLFTSKLEPTGGVLLEAYASHVPIVATNAAGIPEVVNHNQTGLLCEKENPESFAEAVLTVLENKEQKEKFIKNGFKHLKENFTKEVITEKMYDELLKIHKNHS